MHDVRTHARSMTHAHLSKDDVRRIRMKLGWSRPTLARRMGVSESAVRAWEDDQNPCQGAAAVLLGVLERDPLATARVLERSHGLPSPHAEEGTEEWFQFQRLLWLMSDVSTVSGSFWAALVAVESLRQQWLDELEDAMLVGPVRTARGLAPTNEHPGMRATTEAGRIRFHLRAYEAWLHETWDVGYDTIHALSCATLADRSAIASVPVMNASAFDVVLTAE